MSYVITLKDKRGKDAVVCIDGALNEFIGYGIGDMTWFFQDHTQAWKTRKRLEAEGMFADHTEWAIKRVALEDAAA